MAEPRPASQPAPDARGTRNYRVTIRGAVTPRAVTSRSTRHAAAGAPRRAIRRPREVLRPPAAHPRSGNAARHAACDAAAAEVAHMLRTHTRLLASLALALGLWLTLAGTASATPIGPGAFGALAVVESFEGVATGPNVVIGLGASLLEPGTVSAYAFPTGVSLTSPIPNPGYDLAGPFLHDFARGADVQNNWGANGTVNDAGDVPVGDAYLGAFAVSGTVSFAFGFDVAMDRVGAYVTGAGGSTIRLDVYGAGGALLESRTMGSVPVAQWGANFLGIENLAGIESVVFTGTDFGIDGLTFEASPVVVPEPGTLSAVALGLAGLLGIAMLGNRSPSQPARTPPAPRPL